MLKCIAGVYQPTSGTIRARGRIATFIELGVGFNPELDACDNVVLNATLLGMTATEARAKFDEIIA
ncbi:MAG: ABC transporter ATP-binding protein, partial [Thermoleophilia bacterium]|nr:ABC transporter ATP-binding protein [Thermoleophilia bacterium]